MHTNDTILKYKLIININVNVNEKDSHCSHNTIQVIFFKEIIPGNNIK